MTLLGEGRNRRVYLHKGFAIKIPINEIGYHDNWLEAHISNQYGRRGESIQYARCKLTTKGILVMEFVTPFKDPYKECEWAGYIDCGQVGQTKSGRVVAYDFGS